MDIDCPRSCTRRIPKPLHVFGSLHHMHLLGMSIGTSANGVLLHQTEYYDHDQQHYLPVNFTIPPDAVITTRCRFTNPLSHPVRFGPATSDEMCMQSFYYYPRIEAPGLEQLPFCGMAYDMDKYACGMMNETFPLEENDVIFRIPDLKKEPKYSPTFGAGSAAAAATEATDAAPAATGAAAKKRGVLSAEGGISLEWLKRATVGLLGAQGDAA